MGNITESFLESVAQNWKLVTAILPLTGIYELGDPETTPSMKGFCRLASAICNKLQASLNSGEASTYNSQTASTTAASRPQSNCSVKQALHYGQLVESNKFQKFDFGSSWSNKSAYGQKSPPNIPLNEVEAVPIAMFVGKYDTLGDPTDAAQAFATVENGVFFKEYDNMDHFSFMVGKETSYTNDLLAQIQKVAQTAPVEEELPMDYPFTEDAALNLY